MLVWLAGWTVGCVFLIGNVIQNPGLFNIAFAIPFWASWFFVFGAMIASFTLRHDIYLDANEFRWISSAPFWRKVRRYPIGECQRFVARTRSTRSSHEQAHYCMTLETRGNPVPFGDYLPEPEQDWLAWKFNQVLQVLKETAHSATSVVTEEPSRHGRPSDSSWDWIEGSDPTFEQKGRFQLGAVGGLVFFCLFWNGIVSVFVMQLFGVGPAANGIPGFGWWGLFFFLIPFEVIGLAMLFALLVTLLEPLRTTTWTFGPNQVKTRTSWFGLGWTRTWPVTGPITLLYRKTSGRRAVAIQQSGESKPSWEMVLITADNVELCSMKNLTQGEAEWVKAMLTEHWTQARRSSAGLTG